MFLLLPARCLNPQAYVALPSPRAEIWSHLIHPLAFPEELVLLLSPSSLGADVGLVSVIAAVTEPWLVLWEGTFTLVQNNCSAKHPVGNC